VLQVFVDECHATGFVGPTGRGTDEYWGVRGQVDIINSTLGKALGGATGESSFVGLLPSCTVWVYGDVSLLHYEVHWQAHMYSAP
jgi:hypothetical protein